jgi:hypothetical protein
MGYHSLCGHVETTETILDASSACSLAFSQVVLDLPQETSEALPPTK